jgi:hypothetical protein
LFADLEAGEFYPEDLDARTLERLRGLMRDTDG